MIEDKHFVSCGCRDEYVGHRAFSFANAAPMPERSEFTDNCQYIRHYCPEHWEEREARQ